MHRATIFLIFIGVFLLLDFYNFQGIKYLSRNLSSIPQNIIRYGYWIISSVTLFGLLMIFGGFVDSGSRFWRTLIFGSLAVVYFPKIFLTFFTLLDDGQRFVRWIAAKFSTPSSDPIVQADSNITRSEFLLKTGVAVASVPFLATSWGIASGAHDYRVKRKTILLPNLPKEFDGITIGQISDIHSGSFFNKTAVKGGIELLNSEKPDIAFFTGDLVNDRALEVKEYMGIFDKISAPLGVYSVLGNHDYGDYYKWSSKEEWKQNMRDLFEAHKALGWDLMLNDNRKITVDGESIGLIGVENWGLGFSQHGDLAKAYKGIEEQAVKILLSHDPTHWDAQVRKDFGDIDLTLSGHTHGMQMGISIGDFEWSPSKWRYERWGGHYQEGNQHLYVNRGYGFIGLPARIGMPPEITMLTLKKG